jgi:predicted transcriptional regulator
MRFPNLRYGNPTEFAYYAMGRTHAELARALRRDERTIRDWLSGRAKVPWWVPEILRLKRLEADMRHRQMFWALEEKPRLTKLGVVSPEGVLELRQPAATKKPEASDQDSKLARAIV